MPRIVFGLFVVMAVGASGQAPNAASPAADTPDLASAYYFYATAHIYALKATKPDGTPNTENVNRAIENYRAALKADPQVSPVVNQELSDMVEHGHLRPRLLGTGFPPRPLR